MRKDRFFPMQFESIALNAICPYFTMFSVDFPLLQLEGLPPGSWVLDPFCGRGTTAFAARMLRMHSVNVDISPVAAAIAKAKLAHTDPGSILSLAERLLEAPLEEEVPKGDFWRLAFHESVLEDLSKFRQALVHLHSAEANALRGIILGALHGPTPKTKDSYFSNQMPRTFAAKPGYSVKYWLKKGLQPRRVHALSLILERAERYYKNPAPPMQGIVLHSDARHFPDPGVRFDALITSPPYFGMGTYVEDQWLRNWFLGGPPKVDYYHPEQLGTATLENFTKGLSEVWRHIGTMMNSGGKIVIRMGALRSFKSDPEKIVIESVESAAVNWHPVAVHRAGIPTEKARQASHMGQVAAVNQAQEELDFVFTSF